MNVRRVGTIRRVQEGAVAHIVIDNPARRNAISLGMWRELDAIADALASDSSTRAVILRGEPGTNFASGADISEFDAHRSEAGSAVYDDVSKTALRKLETLPLPVIAAIEGYCIGAGIALALSCDLRIAADSASFALPAARIGLGYELGSLWRLADEVGPAAARWMIYTGQPFAAARALLMGLVHEVLPAGKLLASATSLAEAVAANAPLTIRAAKAGLRARQDRALDDAAAEAVERCFASADYAEGRRAFAEKRAPVFTGR